MLERVVVLSLTMMMRIALLLEGGGRAMRRRERHGWWRAQCRLQRRLCEGRSVDGNFKLVKQLHMII